MKLILIAIISFLCGAVIGYFISVVYSSYKDIKSVYNIARHIDYKKVGNIISKVPLNAGVTDNVMSFFSNMRKKQHVEHNDVNNTNIENHG